MISFKVDPVAVESKTLPTVAVRNGIGPLIQKTQETLEDCGGDDILKSAIPIHGFVAAIHEAYSDHRPLTITPDQVWLVIVQGISTHVNQDPEKYRALFVRHEGKKKIVVRRDSFVMGGHNDWGPVLSEFSGKIGDYIGPIHGRLQPAFSTTTPLSHAAASCALMSMTQGYFSYEVLTMCGIPEIRLDGTVEDWERIRANAEILGEFGLNDWRGRLLPVLDQFVLAAKGQADTAFWRDLYKYADAGSGSPRISGHVRFLFPYVRKYSGSYADGKFNSEYKLVANPWGTLTTTSFPDGLASAPFVWDYLGDRREMRFYAGFTGVGVKDDALTPGLGWIVSTRKQ
jgi:hypothetical protein